MICDMKTTKVQQKLGQAIQNKRLELKMSQEQLADLAGLHRTYIGSVERGERNISLKNIVLIAKAVKLKVKDLFSIIDC